MFLKLNYLSTQISALTIVLTDDGYFCADVYEQKL